MGFEVLLSTKRVIPSAYPRSFDRVDLYELRVGPQRGGPPPTTVWRGPREDQAKR